MAILKWNLAWIGIFGFLFMKNIQGVHEIKKKTYIFYVMPQNNITV